MLTLKEIVQRDSEAAIEVCRQLSALNQPIVANVVRLGCNVPVKPSAIMSLKFEQFVHNANGDYFIKDTGTHNHLYAVNSAGVAALKECSFLNSTASKYLFTPNRRSPSGTEYMTRNTASRLFRKLDFRLPNGSAMSLEELRRMWGRRYMLDKSDIAITRDALGKGSIARTIGCLKLQGVDVPYTSTPRKRHIFCGEALPLASSLNC